MKKIIAGMLISGMMLTFYSPVIAQKNVWKEFYVSPYGNDNNDGSKTSPFATVSAAKNAVRKINSQMQGDIIVNIEEGYYFMDETLELRTEDSGFNGHRVIWRGIGDTKPVLSGGKRVSNFSESEYDGIYVADYDADYVMQLSVNNKRRSMAKGAKQIVGQVKPEKYRSEEWYEQHPNDVLGDDYNWYDPETPYKYDGMFLSKKDFGIYENYQDVIFQWDHEWTTRSVTVEEVKECPEDSTLLMVRMEPGWWNYGVLGGTSSNIWPKAKREFTVMNALELLDEPGEFYYNRHTKKLYYMPDETEDMSTAVVIAPVLDTILHIDGYDVTDKVKNITIENLQFSDTKWHYPKGAYLDQGNMNTQLGGSHTAPRGVLVYRADGIKLKNNIFCNLGGGGLGLINAVTNTEVVGNALWDIGEHGIAIGTENHGTYALGEDAVSNNIPAEYKDAPIDLVSFDNTMMDASYYREDRTTENGYGLAAVNYPGYPWADDHDDKGQYDKIHKTWVEEYKSAPYNWVDNHSAKNGEKPWFKFGFIRPYSINKITVSFNQEMLKAGQNADYEILVSNDINFTEGNYKVVATQNGVAPAEVNHYEFDDDTKYKYVLIRKTTASDFALSRVWIETTDEKPFIKNERCNHLTIKNNALQRVGVDAPGHSNGIITTQIADTDLSHNDVRDVGYTGIATGFSWNKLWGNSENVNMTYNYVYDSNQTGHDGGGIYTLGINKNSLFAHNYIEMTGQGKHSFYTDNGSSYFKMVNNFIEADSFIYNPYVQGTGNGAQWYLEYLDYHGTHGMTRLGSDWEKRGITIEPVTVEVIGQPSRGIYDTYTNAGLEDEYKYLRDLIPQGHNNLYYKYYYNEAVMSQERGNGTPDTIKAIKDQLQYTYDNAQYGTGLGLYPIRVKYEIDEMISYFGGSENPDQYMRVTLAREFLHDIKSKLMRYSVDETLKLCTDLLEAAKKDSSYPQSAVIEFENIINTAKAMDAKVAEDEFDKLTMLENAYNELIKNKCSVNIADVYVKGSSSVDIDCENRVVTVYMPHGTQQTVDEIVIALEGDAKLARTMPKQIDLESGLIVPVYSKGMNSYATWTIKASDIPYSDEGVITGKVWNINSNETNLIKYNRDGITLPASCYAYMSNIGGGNKTTKLKFKPMSPNDSYELNMLFGANSPYGFEYGNNNAKYNRCEVVFKDDLAMFYKVNSGKKTLIDTSYSKIKWNEDNELEYEITEINNQNTHFKITLNGNLIFSELIEKCTYGKYMGIYTPSLNVKVY